MAQERNGGQSSVWEQRWRERLCAWRTSGQTQQEFCKAQGISISSFSHWKGELAKRDLSRAQAVSGPVATSDDTSTALPGTMGWTEVRLPLMGSGEARPGSMFEIVLPRGWSVRLGPQFEAEPLRRLLSVLEERSC